MSAVRAKTSVGRELCALLCVMCAFHCDRIARKMRKRSWATYSLYVLIRASSVLIDRIVFMDVIRDLVCVNAQC